jgi:hypothetical protein
MPLHLLFANPFYRCLKQFDVQQIETIELILRALKVYYAANAHISSTQRIAPRFFYKKLRHEWYEAGVEGKLRVVIRKDGLNCTAMFAGNHDQIRRFLTTH